MPSSRFDNTYYKQTANEAVPREPLVGLRETRVCIIGGGLSGVSTALHLAELGQESILLEADHLGAGASGRNGGQLVTGYPVDFATVDARLAQSEILDLWDMAVEAQVYVRQMIARWNIQWVRLFWNEAEQRGNNDLVR